MRNATKLTCHCDPASKVELSLNNKWSCLHCKRMAQQNVQCNRARTFRFKINQADYTASEKCNTSMQPCNTPSERNKTRMFPFESMTLPALQLLCITARVQRSKTRTLPVCDPASLQVRNATLLVFLLESTKLYTLQAYKAARKHSLDVFNVI